MIVLGTMALVSAISCVVTSKQQWISSGLWIGHLLIPSGAFGFYQQTSVLMMVLILAVSATSWLIGVVTLRRGWRVFGAIDLILAWIVAGILMLAGGTSLMLRRAIEFSISALFLIRPDLCCDPAESYPSERQFLKIIWNCCFCIYWWINKNSDSDSDS